MKYYPICLDISNRRCVVIGGGDVAERKVMRLLECGADVVVAGKKLNQKLEAMKNDGKIGHIAADYGEEYIRDAFMVIGATDSDDVNERIYRDAGKMGILVNIVDDPARCDFILPSLFQQGDLQIAVSTGGKSPALAKRLREEMEERYGPEYKTLLDIMGAVREKVIARGHPPEENRRLFESLINSEILQYIREKNWKKVRKVIYDLVGENVDIAELDR
ncbi:MAG: bifunctional precorrin-2 dehydrogenase/sirohydrochlorin ferrochelatase [Proteobacteria bacterium]|nr:bifunctional precorrin-2 dehydrogenase/sirohydrochlorin ferrochelatase [Pseudomonadota bacterium]